MASGKKKGNLRNLKEKEREASWGGECDETAWFLFFVLACLRPAPLRALLGFLL